MEELDKILRSFEESSCVYILRHHVKSLCWLGRDPAYRMTLAGFHYRATWGVHLPIIRLSRGEATVTVLGDPNGTIMFHYRGPPLHCSPRDLTCRPVSRGEYLDLIQEEETSFWRHWTHEEFDADIVSLRKELPTGEIVVSYASPARKARWAARKISPEWLSDRWGSHNRAWGSVLDLLDRKEPCIWVARRPPYGKDFGPFLPGKTEFTVTLCTVNNLPGWLRIRDILLGAP